METSWFGSYLQDFDCRGTWQVERQQSNPEESLNSGTEGEWRQDGAEQNNNNVNNNKDGEQNNVNNSDVKNSEVKQEMEMKDGGEWRLQEDKIWGVELTTAENKSEDKTGVWRTKYCCCDHLTEIKIFITIFGLINLGIMASGGVGFGLGLTNTHREDTFKYLMVRS